jgi:hypothetical protein
MPEGSGFPPEFIPYLDTGRDDNFSINIQLTFYDNISTYKKEAWFLKTMPL